MHKTPFQYQPRDAAFFIRLKQHTLAEIEQLIKRDNIRSRAEFLERALVAYKLYSPGPDYWPKS